MSKVDEWDEISIPMPLAFRSSVVKAARANLMQPIEYCRRRLLEALERDGVPVTRPPKMKQKAAHSLKVEP
jgi:hypothetical protein